MPDKTIHNRLKENGYEAQGRGPGALWKKKKINILFPQHFVYPGSGIRQPGSGIRDPGSGIRDPATRHQKDLFP